jgi:phage virion morphogenesis protein
MGAFVEVKLNEVEKLAQKLNSYALTSSQKRVLLDSLGETVEEQTGVRFDETKTAPSGTKWDEWKPSTLKYLQKNFPKATLLVRTGFLGNLSISHEMRGNDTVLIGSSAEYAEYIQEGTRNMNARPFLGLGVSDIDELSDAVDIFIRGHMR